ncbi:MULTISPECIES: hypothetical protein [unclassified Nocardioides]|uniref:hypothetical protein n=1 Tax=unclassified Nocardioides TaxID=2615069 RepID=UPI000056F750|nr:MULTISPECIES: hypothetical protein [unclassified Nocardioides]ABL80985.1 integral membrane protein [Nocardioides sp. JS614]
MVSALLWALIGGTVIGLLGKALAPGDRDDVPLWLTVICGIGGVLIGNFLYGLFFADHSRGIDWWRHGWQVAVAAVLVASASVSAGRARSQPESDRADPHR